MKKCGEIKELISLYIDDELDLNQRSELEAHAESCEECKNELKELTQIVGLCRDVAEEELPANFKTELHQKLLEVQEQSMEANKPAFYQGKYFRLFSSVAAVFLLVFLIRGYHNFDLFSGVKKDINDMNSLTAETLAGNLMQRSAQMPESALEAEDSKKYNVADFGDKNSDGKTLANGSEIDRSTNDRENKMYMAGVTVNESITKNSASIIISVDDPTSQAEKVRQAAKTTSGLDQTDIEADSYTVTEEGVVLQLSIPNMQLDEFIDTLHNNYGQDNVQLEAVITEDMTIAVEELCNEANKLDALIKNAESSSEENTDEIVNIRDKKAEIESKIDALRLESDLTKVKIILKKK